MASEFATIAADDLAFILDEHGQSMTVKLQSSHTINDRGDRTQSYDSYTLTGVVAQIPDDTLGSLPTGFVDNGALQVITDPNYSVSTTDQITLNSKTYDIRRVQEYGDATKVVQVLTINPTST